MYANVSLLDGEETSEVSVSCTILCFCVCNGRPLSHDPPSLHPTCSACTPLNLI